MVIIQVAQKELASIRTCRWDYALVEATGMGVVAGLAAELLPLPHLTLTLWPSMSMPFAQASAARSAESRSLKLMNAHLGYC